MSVLAAAVAWACLLFLVWLARIIRSRRIPSDVFADLLDHLWLLFYEPIHTVSRFWYRIRAFARTLRSLK